MHCKWPGLVLSACLSLAPLAADPAAGRDPASAVAKAREEIAAGNPAAALRTLREATAAAASITDAHQRAAALSAIHFYGALAASNAGEKEQATAELRSFFLYNPGSKLDTGRYPTEFASLFSDVQKRTAEARANPATFDDAYPGFPPAVSSSVWPAPLWGASSEFMILATPDEREAWGKLGSDEQRSRFIQLFWDSRDPDSSTGVNEARIELLGRIAFADVAFAEDIDGRGSLTDRGRVFVLLGPPRRVSIRPMSRREAWYAPRRTIDAGNSIEQWTYFREQLPQKLPHNEVTFRFVAEGGSSSRTLQREFLSEKVIKDTPAALKR